MRYPDEDVVNELAVKWSVDTFLDDYQDTKSTGFYVYYKNS